MRLFTEAYTKLDENMRNPHKSETKSDSTVMTEEEQTPVQILVTDCETPPIISTQKPKFAQFTSDFLQPLPVSLESSGTQQQLQLPSKSVQEQRMRYLQRLTYKEVWLPPSKQVKSH